MTSTLTYVYCLTRGARPPSLRGAPPGVPGGGPVRALDVGDTLIPARQRNRAAATRTRNATRRGSTDGVWLIVSSVPERHYGEAAVDRGFRDLEWVGRRAMAHEEVVEYFLRGRSVLPMQLLTLFTSDERAVEHVARDRRRIARILDRVEGQVEWGVRLTWNERAARDAVERRHARSRPAARAPGRGRRRDDDKVGTAYLARKRDLLDVNRMQLADARRAAGQLYKVMTREATDARRQMATERAAAGSRLLLDAAFLVPVGGAAAFRTALRRHARPLAAAGIQVSLTGPWPPYNFI